MEQTKQKENTKWKYPSSISMASEAQEIPFGYAKYINEEGTLITYIDLGSESSGNKDSQKSGVGYLCVTVSASQKTLRKYPQRLSQL